MEWCWGPSAQSLEDVPTIAEEGKETAKNFICLGSCSPCRKRELLWRSINVRKRTRAKRTVTTKVVPGESCFPLLCSWGQCQRALKLNAKFLHGPAMLPPARCYVL